MIRYLCAALIAGALTICAQGAPAQAARPDSLSVPEAAPMQPDFYHPPVIREVWDRFYRLVDSVDDQTLTRRFVQALLDSLAEIVQADFDSLARRARAFETAPRGYTHQFYRSPLTRNKILGAPITEKEASEVPHFHAVYDPQGYLVSVRYAEPRKWRARQRLLSRGTYQPKPGAPPLVRYFQLWDVRRLEPDAYTRRKKIPEQEAYLRVLYDEQDHIKSVQSYDQQGKLVFSVNYSRLAADSSSYARLEFSGDSSGSLLTIHPYVYLREWSVVKPGWKVALTSDTDGNLTSTQVFNRFDQLSYYYTFSTSVDEKTDKRTLRGTALSDADSILQVFAMVYDKQDRMVRRSFFTTDGELVETTIYKYNPRTAELQVTVKDAIGRITSRQRFMKPAYWR